MRKKFLLNSFSLLFVLGLSLATPEIMGTMTKLGHIIPPSPKQLQQNVFAANCGTTVLWHNLSGCGSSGIPNGTYIDTNIDVIGTNALQKVSVVAATCDIVITVTNGDAIITGTGSRCDGVPTSPAQLFLYAAAGRTITVEVVDDLTFSGAVTGTTPLDLLITFSGGGELFFDVNGGSSVSFTQLNPTTGGTRFFAGMTADNPQVIFAQTPAAPTLNSNVIVGPNSTISYVAQFNNPLSTGIIEFQPINNNLQLVIQNGGGVNIAGHPADLTNPNLMITDINMNAQAGTSANFIVGANGPNGSVSIVNGNNLCPEGLTINPFCQAVSTLPSSSFFPGFVLAGPTGVITVDDQTYITYVGTATNTCCDFSLPDQCGILEPMERLRNGSALIIDSTDDFSPATIILNGSSAIYFLSGVDNCGSVSPDFTVNSSVLNTCAGNIVLDVEGPLDIFGSSTVNTGISILSLQVNDTGCPVTIDSTTGSNFPQRTFNRQPNGQYISYNLGCFLVNNVMTLNNTSLIHTDTIHKVYEHWNLGNPNLSSEPTYIGGDSYLFPCHLGRPRPTIELINSTLRVHSSICSTGVDWLVPNSAAGDNTSSIIFYSNGRCIDNGYGRNMILGTDVCFDLCDTGTDLDSHLNVFQIDSQTAGFSINLDLLTAYNNSCITQGITSTQSIAGQNSVQTIYLNNASNFSIGTDGNFGVDRFGNVFDLTIPANVFINGSCFSFETRGGTIAFPQESGVTGEGGIFVDAEGSLTLVGSRIASFGAMVTKSRGGIVNLPSNQVFFEPRIGITEWQPDLSQLDQRILVAPNQSLSDYSFDWGAAKKTFCCNSLVASSTCFIPYDTEEVPGICAAPLVTQNNLVNLPTVQGEVDQLQILRSRICDTAHLLIDGGFVRELVFLQSFQSAQAPTAFLVMQNDSIVGLGSAHKDVDSLEASIVLGINGVMLVPNGNCAIELNEDVIINNVCHVLSGTSFGQGGNVNTLTISSTTPKELRIKSTGILDLTQFTLPGQQFEISGYVKLVCEPGARIAMNGGTFIFSDQAQWYLEPDARGLTSTPLTVNSTDSIRVKLSGTGIINMIENSSMLIPADAYFGVETYVTCSPITNISWILNDQSSIQIGNNALPGGAFQIGDTVISGTQQSISFNLELSGQGALFDLNRHGFFGLGAGSILQTQDLNPNQWLIGCLSNVTEASVIVGGPVGIRTTPGGTFSHNQIASGDTEEASLLAIGSEGTYSFLFNAATAVILGGGNMVKINCTDGLPVSFVPTVTTFAGIQPGGLVQSGIMSGKLLLQDLAKPQQPAGGTSLTPQGLFNYLSTIDNFAQRTPKANITSNALNLVNLGFVLNSVIRRDALPEIRGKTGGIVSDQHSLQIAAVQLIVDPNAGSFVAYEIQGTGDF